MEDALRLQDATGLGNNVTHIFREAITAAVKDALMSDDAGDDRLDSDDSVEVIRVGKKRGAASPAPDAPALKKLANGKGESLPVLQLDLGFAPPKDLDETLRNLVKKHGKALLEGENASLPLCDIVFQHARDNAKSPHRLYIRRADTNAALVELDPVDPTCAVAQSWVSWIAPPPLTKSGKPYKKARNAAKAPQRQPVAVVPTGAGGLVDALAVLGDLNGQGVSVVPRFSLEVAGAFGSMAEPQLRIRLQIEVSIDPFEFYEAAYHRSRRILIDYLLPSTDPLNTGTDVPAEASVDYFYACLRRAPRTEKGLPILSDASAAQTPAAALPAESDEEREARLRRAAKGKQRAVDPDPDPNSEAGPVGEECGAAIEKEDEMLYPQGLTVGLMPFQARTIRWMLAREGKRVNPRGGVEEEATGANGRGEEVEEMRNGDGIGAADEPEDDDDDDDDLYAAPRPSNSKKGKGKARVEPEEEQETNGSPPELEDLDVATLRRMKRGPLWEQVELPNLDSCTREPAGFKQLWFNRTLLSFSVTDPVDTVGPSGAATPVVKPEPSDGDEIAEAAEEHASRKVVGGREGHGLLAEEVGLGKTVEALSLILTHRDDNRRKLPAYYNPVVDSEVQPCGATLIIAPTAIIGQWETEIARLAPQLRVLRYSGVRFLNKQHEKHDKRWMAKHFDIVLTTFDVLRKEVAFARAPTQRGLRNKREVRYRRSLLVELDFLRVLMDEAQMVGDAYGPTSETASLISRRFSWAVTSTPLRDKIADIKPLLTFLRVEPIASGKANIQRLLDETASFKKLWNEIGERTLKSQVQHELFLPQQIRYIVPIELTAVERYYYDQRYNEALKVLGLDEEGFPVQPPNDPEWTWEPDKSEMLRALTTLRQLCTHPQIGSSNKEALGRVLKTVDEVYAAMREKAVSEIQSAQRAMLQARVKRAQYQMWDKDDTEERFARALALFKSATEEVEPIIEEVSNEIHAVWQSRKPDPSRDSPTDLADKGVAGALELGYRSENVDENQIMSETERNLSTRVSALRNRLRDLLFVKHSSLFFSGHACFNMKRSEEESLFYQTAEHLRQTILQPYENAVESAQATLKRQIDIREAEHELSIDDFEIQFDTQGHGLRGITTFEKIGLTSDLMNGYAELLFSYREQIVQMLLKVVSIAGDNATGEEYEERAALQERLNVYLEAYTVLVGEWTYGVDGTRSALSDQYKAEMSAYLYKQEVLPEAKSPPPGGIEPDAPIEDLQEAVEDALMAIAGPSGRNAREQANEDDSESEEEGGGKRKGKKKKGQNKKKEKSRFQAKRGANLKTNSYKDFLAPTLESGHAPADVLRYELLVERLESKGEDNEFAEVVPIRQLIKTLRDAEEAAGSKKEVALLERERKRLQGYLTSLGKVSDRLRAELSDFTKAFNARLTYFANLQQISDEVADPDMDSKQWRGLLIEIETLRQEELEQKAAIESKQSRRRYLDNLNSPAEREEAETTCPICSEHFTAGILTNCGHLTCAACFRKWHSVSKNCALCKQTLGAGSYTNVSYRKKATPPPSVGEAPQKYIDSHGIEHAFAEQAPLLSEMDEPMREAIASIETTTPLSSKSDFIVKHVKYIRRRDPDAKIVIFSNWQEALSLLMEAFSRNGVRYIRLEGVNGQGKKEGVVKRFQEDPDIAAFLLHTKSQAAGLNLTVARYVFLVEPLLHPSLELQAVARVHRITQTKDTYVYKYAVSDTVDRRVEELRASQNTSLFLASDGGVNAAKESRMVQQTERASAAARKVAKTDELIDDEDQIAQILLSPSAFQNLQRSLLPARLRTQEGGAEPRSNGPRAAAAGEDEGVRAAPVAGGSGGAIHAAGGAAEPAALAGIAAAGRAAQEEEEEAGVRAYEAQGQDAAEAEMMDVDTAAAAAARPYHE